ncbi:MAG: ribosome-binding factor A [Candidatus Paceibacterota bacterium]
MASRRQIQVAETLAHLAADFFARESNGQSLVTVTHADVSPDLKNVMIYFTVMPEKFQNNALQFAKRNRTEFRDYVKTHASMKFLPTFDFEIDLGELNRQRIDELTRT